MSTPCIPCGVDLNCDFTDPLDLYSLQGATFQYVIVCPAGYDCSNSDSVTIECCDQDLTVQIPEDATAAQRTALIDDLVQRCVLRQEFCVTTIPPNTPPPTIPPPNRTRYFNREIKLSSECEPPTGVESQGTFNYILKAGVFIADTQAAADKLATDYAKNNLVDTKFCIKPACLAPCAGALSGYRMSIVGGIGPFKSQIISGYRPVGTNFSISGKALTYTGTANTPGPYSVRVRVVDLATKNATSYWEYTFPIRVLKIGYATYTQAVMVVPAVAATVVVAMLPVTNMVVGDVIYMAKLNGSGKVTLEGGTFEVTNISGTNVTLENLTGTAGVSLPSGSLGTFALDTIPEYETGVAYSFQLPATGGSGSYSWKITAGSLPTGLEMAIGGLISGTPTDVADASFTAEFIDLDCDKVNESFYRPVATIVGTSQTTIATVRGFEAFFPYQVVPPRAFRTRTWTALMTGNDAAGNPVSLNEGSSAYMYAQTSGQLANAMVTMVGADRINLAGTRLETAQTKLYSSCPNSNVQPLAIGLNSGIFPGWSFDYNTALSYAGRTDPTPVTCPGGVFPLMLDTSVAATKLVGTTPSSTLFGGASVASSATYAQNSDFGIWLLGLFGAPPMQNPTFLTLPPNLGYPLLIGQSAYIEYKHNYEITLTDEYTDALALANAKIVNSNSVVAANFPRTTGFVSVWTTVTYAVKLRNLIFGNRYLVTVTLQTDEFVNTLRSYNFTAAGSTHTITDTIPTPDVGHTITVKNPTAAYA